MSDALAARTIMSEFWPRQGGPMAQDIQSGQPAHSSSSYVEQPTGWTGWVAFAAVLMVMLGFFHGIQGLVALFDDQKFAVTDSGLVVSVDYTAWGWTHLIGGVILVLAGVSLFAGRMWARVVGVVVALASAIVNISFLFAYPIWSTIMIALDIIIIWAITVHGSEMKVE
jgi:hypothetical protein